jgi:hypothetical protein
VAAEPPKVAAEIATKRSQYLEFAKENSADPDMPVLQEYVEAFGPERAFDLWQVAISAFAADKKQVIYTREAAEQSKHTEARERLHVSNEAGAEKYPDWDAVMNSPAGKKYLPPAIVNEILELESSEDVRYHLLTHEDDFSALAAITDPIAAARAIGRLSARLVAVEAPASGPVETPRGSRAKPLIKPVSASPAAPEASPPDAIPFGPRYIQAMNELERKQRGARGA